MGEHKRRQHNREGKYTGVPRFYRQVGPWYMPKDLFEKFEEQRERIRTEQKLDELKQQDFALGLIRSSLDLLERDQKAQEQKGSLILDPGRALSPEELKQISERLSFAKGEPK